MERESSATSYMKYHFARIDNDQRLSLEKHVSRVSGPRFNSCKDS